MLPKTSTYRYFEEANRQAAKLLDNEQDTQKKAFQERSSYIGRNVPHPRTVKHFRGLLDKPTVIVDDEGMLRNGAPTFLPNKYPRGTQACQRPPQYCMDVITGFLSHRHVERPNRDDANQLKQLEAKEHESEQQLT